MDAALSEAREAQGKGEVPVGAVLAVDGEIVASAHNEVEDRNDVSAHAEMLVIRRASECLKNWRLSKAILCVTLEPCAMCMGAIKLARIPMLAFGARDERLGAAGSLYDLSAGYDALRVISGVQEVECREILQAFFKEKRI